MYSERVRELKTQGLIGLGIGLAIGIYACVSSGSFTLIGLIAFSVLFAGTPYGWKKFGGIFNFLLIGSVPMMLIGFMLRGGCAILAGWFLYPIALIWNIIQAKNENSSDT